jgi:lipoprotein-anchoring transpeptidase ErfK/SrfK
MPTLTPSPTPKAEELGRHIVVDQDEQLMHVFEGGVEIRTIPVSTGKPSPTTKTPAWSGAVGEYWGTFFAFGVHVDDAWFLFKSLGSILIHSVPYVYEDGKKVYQDLEALGKHPASHGCIRLHPDDARWFTEWKPQGVPIVITGWTGEETP